MFRGDSIWRGVENGGHSASTEQWLHMLPGQLEARNLGDPGQKHSSVVLLEG